MCGFGTGIDIAKLTVLMASFLVGLNTPGWPVAGTQPGAGQAETCTVEQQGSGSHVPGQRYFSSRKSCAMLFQGSTHA